MRRAGGLLCDVRDSLGALCNLPRTHKELANGGRDLAHGGGLPSGTRRLLISRGLELCRGALDVPHRRSDLACQRPRYQDASGGYQQQREQGSEEYGLLCPGWRRFDFLGAPLEQFCFLVLHLRQYASKIVHLLLSLSRLDNLCCLLKTCVLSQFNSSL